MSRIDDEAYHKFVAGELVDGDDSPTGANLNTVFKLFQSAINDNFERLDELQTLVENGGGGGDIDTTGLAQLSGASFSGEISAPNVTSNLWLTTSSSSDGTALLGQNCYYNNGAYYFRNTHASMGARGIVYKNGAAGFAPYYFDTGAIATIADNTFTPTLIPMSTQATTIADHKNYAGADLHVAKSTPGTGSPIGVRAPSIAGELYTDLNTGTIYTGTGTTVNSWVAGGSVTVPSDTTPPTPPAVSASNVTENAVTLSWTASSDNVGVIGYDVYQGVAKLATVGATTTQYSVTGLSASTAYTFQVLAKDAAGNVSTSSNIVTITTSATVAPPPDDPSALTVTLTESSEAFANPMMGFRPGRDVNVTSFKAHEYATVFKHYIKYTDLEVDATDTAQKIKDWSNGAAWANIQNRNLKIVPRVVIVQPGSGEFFPNGISHTTVAEPWEASNTTMINRLVAFIAKMGEAWDNDPRVAFIELGLWGKWGEHHISPDKLSDGTDHIPLSFQTAMGNAAVAAFKNKKVTIRYPHNSFTAFDFGTYWDSFAVPNDASSGNGEINKNNWRTQIESGEVAYNWGDQSKLGGSPDANLSIPANVNYVIDWIMKTHTSSLGWISDYTATNTAVEAGATAVQKVLGYRYVLSQVTFTSNVTPGGNDLNITFKVTNKGSSSFYYDYPVEACLLDSSGVVAWKGLFKTDIRNWLPGTSWNTATRAYDTPPAVNTVTGSFTIPATVANGTYTLALSILDPSGWNPSIRFANTNYYAGGRTPIGKVGIGGAPSDQTLNTFAGLKADTTLTYSLTSSAYTGSISGVDPTTPPPDPSPTTLYSDTFSGGDSPSTLAGYTASSGTWGTLSGEAYSTSNTDGAIVLTSSGITGIGTGDFTASCKMKGALADGANSTRMNFIFKAADNTNFLYISPVGGQIALRKSDTGTLSTIGIPGAVTLANNTYYVFKVVYTAAVGNIKVYVDNVLKVDYTLSGAELTKYGVSTYNKIGWRYNYIGTPATTSRIDDLLVTAPTVADTTPPIVSITPAAGTYTSTQTVTLSANETATIYYTTDGTAPTTSSAVYSTAIPVGATTTIRYFGRDTAGNESTVQDAVYTINAPPLFSDDFNRTPSATTLGASWTVVGSGTWGTTGTEAYNVSDTDGQIVTANTGGATNYSVTHVAKGCIAAGTDSRRMSLICRYIDGNNFILVSMVGGSMTLAKFDDSAGAGVHPMGSYVTQTTTNDVYYTIQAVCNNSNIKVYVNNILKIDYTMSGAEITKFSGSTKVGWRYNKAGAPTTDARVDSFTVTPTEFTVLPQVTLLSDNFNRANISPVGAPQVGTAPTSYVSAFGVSTNQVACTGDVAGSILLWDVGQADFRYSVKVTGSYGSTNASYPLVVVRGLDSSNYIQLMYANNGTGFNLMKVDTGVFSNIKVSGAGVVSLVDGTTYTIAIVCSGMSITVYVDGVQKLAHTLLDTDAKYAGYTKVGFRYDKTGTPTSPARWDDLVVTNY